MESNVKTYISLLRGINVSGKCRVRMPELRRIYETLNLVNIETYIQSGNVIFDSSQSEPATLIKTIEVEIERTLGISIRVLMRDLNRFQYIIAKNPFTNKRKENPEKLHVTFLSFAPTEDGMKNLPAANGAGLSTDQLVNAFEMKVGSADEFKVIDEEVYLYCPNGYGRTKYSNSFFEKKLNISATTRNWKTVNVLFEMANQR
jgi:uncharacterized protein (DUF1697 family)